MKTQFWAGLGFGGRRYGSFEGRRTTNADPFSLTISMADASIAYNVSIPADKFTLAITMKTTAQAISSAAVKFVLSINMKTAIFTGEVETVFARLVGFVGQTVGRLLGR